MAPRHVKNAVGLVLFLCLLTGDARGQSGDSLYKQRDQYQEETTRKGTFDEVAKEALDASDVEMRTRGAFVVPFVKDTALFERLWSQVIRDDSSDVRTAGWVALLTDRPRVSEEDLRSALEDNAEIVRAAAVLRCERGSLLADAYFDGSTLVRAACLRRLGQLAVEHADESASWRASVADIVSEGVVDADVLVRSNGLIVARRVKCLPASGTIGLLVDSRPLVPLEFVLEADVEGTRLRKLTGVVADEYLLTRYLRRLNLRQTSGLVPPADWNTVLRPIGEAERIGAFALALGVYTGERDVRQAENTVRRFRHLDAKLEKQLFSVVEAWSD